MHDVVPPVAAALPMGRWSSLRGLLGNRLARALLRSTSSGIGTLLLRLASIALLSRLLAPDAFGYYFLGQSVALVLGTAGNLAYSYKLLETVSVSSRNVWAWMAISGMLTAALLIASLVATDLAAPGYTASLLGVGGLAVACSAPLMSAMRTAEALARRLFEFRHLSIAEIGGTTLGFLVVAPLLAAAGMDVLPLVAAHWSYVLFKLAFILRYCLPRLPSVHATAASAAGASGRYSAFGLELLDLASVHVLRLIVGAAFGQAVVALWSRASQLVLLGVNLLIAPVANVLVPLGLRDRERRDHLMEQSAAVVDTLTIVLLPICLAVFMLAGEISVVVFGRAWGGAAPYLQAFSLLVMTRTVQRAFGILGRATQSSGIRLIVDAGTLAAYAVGLMALLAYGPLVAAWAFTASCCLAAAMHFLVHRPGGRRYVPWRYIVALVAFAIVAVAFEHLGGTGMPVLAKLVALAASLALVVGAGVLSAALGRPLVHASLLMRFLHSMDHHTIK